MVSLAGHRSNLGTCRIPSIQLFIRDQGGGRGGYRIFQGGGRIRRMRRKKSGICAGAELTDLTIKSFITFHLACLIQCDAIRWEQLEN